MQADWLALAFSPPKSLDTPGVQSERFCLSAAQTTHLAEQTFEVLFRSHQPCSVARQRGCGCLCPVLLHALHALHAAVGGLSQLAVAVGPEAFVEVAGFQQPRADLVHLDQVLCADALVFVHPALLHIADMLLLFDEGRFGRFGGSVILWGNCLGTRVFVDHVARPLHLPQCQEVQLHQGSLRAESAHGQ